MPLLCDLTAPNGKHIYIATPTSVIYYDRNSDTGSLTNRRVISHLIEESTKKNTLLTLAYKTSGAELMYKPRIAVSPDGNNLYAIDAFECSVVYWNRDKETGTLSNRVSKKNFFANFLSYF